MYNNGESFSFITEKIKEIRIGLFKSEINSELLLPNNVIQVLRVDDAGHIWFFTSCNGRQAANINKTFYAYLDFHKRGTDSRLLLNGTAFIVDEPEEVEELLSESNYSKTVAPSLVLVRMKIMQAEYFEGHDSTKAMSWKEKLFNSFAGLFSDTNHKIFDFG